MEQISNSFSAESAREHPYIVLFMLVIIIGFLVYGLYFYFYNSGEYNTKTGSSYYGRNLLDYTPLFQINTDTLAECINHCNMDITCSGITYNNKTQECIGTSNDGVLRQEDNNIISWVKPPLEAVTAQRDFTKSIIMGYTDNPMVVPSKKITPPQTSAGFAISFNLCIRNYHHN